MKKWLLPLLCLVLMVVLSACGAKSQEDVVGDLNKRMDDLTSYKTKAKMTLQMGTEPQEYNVEVWHNDPDFYRVELKNSQSDQSQMILRNKEGVFVLTPALNKSFRFQSDWPKNSSQPYLYESLVQDIMEDPEATFKETEKHYVFETKTRYQNNKMLPMQEITLSKEDLSPVSVKVMDTDRNPLVTVEFSDTEFNSKFNPDAFDMKRNMEGAQLDKETAADVDEEQSQGDEFAVMYSNDVAAKLIEEKMIDTEDGNRVIQMYQYQSADSTKKFTLIQEKAEIMPAGAMASTPVNGEPVDLGFTVGAMTATGIQWTYDGVEYMLASSELTPEEMVSVARSVQGTMVK
ncbi:outer membrane lipoprotein-sorting protein [Bacillus oleivorans]|uniref:Outer membrane lipoprotein-sorting protein n=1 Tax=Bacillus oleivorans TaxID=1448271 RepID=A0A285D4H3_9BACI|nr:outer membrane lipoprotein carrier protein LolA [Bacillus oleivorans]SNX74585.1 outer membrane lipoprotein-sorting protein [Bacillus oleivorans]